MAAKGRLLLQEVAASYYSCVLRTIVIATPVCRFFLEVLCTFVPPVRWLANGWILKRMDAVYGKREEDYKKQEGH